MKKKTLFIVLGILILLFLSIIAYSTILGDPLNIFTSEEEILRGKIVKYNLLEEENPVLACLIGYEENELWCYSKEDYNFLRVTVLEEYIDVKTLTNGLIMLELKDNGLREYDVDLDALLSKWYTEIENNQEEIFFTDIENSVHVDLYDLIQWRLVQERTGEISIDDIKSELELLKDDKYVIMTPARYDDLSSLYEPGSEEFEYWYRFKSSPSVVIKQANENQEWDFEDIHLNYPRLRYLTVGLNALNLEESVNDSLISSYEEYEKSFSEYNDIEDREEITFIAEYVPLGMLNRSGYLYQGWLNGQRDDYFKFLDIYRSDRSNYQIKLNVLYYEYEL